MKKEPTKKETATIFLFGLGLLSFGLLLFWVPVIGTILLVSGAFFTLASLLTILVKVLK